MLYSSSPDSTVKTIHHHLHCYHFYGNNARTLITNKVKSTSGNLVSHDPIFLEIQISLCAYNRGLTIFYRWFCLITPRNQTHQQPSPYMILKTGSFNDGIGMNNHNGIKVRILLCPLLLAVLVLLYCYCQKILLDCLLWTNILKGAKMTVWIYMGSWLSKSFGKLCYGIVFCVTESFETIRQDNLIFEHSQKEI